MPPHKRNKRRRRKALDDGWECYENESGGGSSCGRRETSQSTDSSAQFDLLSMVNNEEERDEKTVVYKTKVVQFLGRSVPIILQNDNGPCPLIAICNVLLLRNNVTLPDVSEISLQNLLTLVAERLLDSNSNIENKDDNYIQNQEQNISDAITLLPQLATGIDVNVRFRNIHDFEFTPQCAIFDLLDIGLVHGWLFDPQDEDTSKVIGSDSYNVLVEKLVALRSNSNSSMSTSDETTVDFAAATTAILGVPCPHSGKSFESLQIPNYCDRRRKGDEEEAAQLMEALQLSSESSGSSCGESVVLVDASSSSSAGAGNDAAVSVINPMPSFTVWESDTTTATTTAAAADAPHPTPAAAAAAAEEDDDSWQREAVKGGGVEVGSESASPSCSDYECVEADEFRAAAGCTEEEEGNRTEEEPLYEGEAMVSGDGEPLYEGEAIDGGDVNKNNKRVTTTEGLIIENFLSNHATQLTYFGLFALQEGMKERELSVFFRNNHFSTMFKYEGDLYLLVTDQGYLTQSDLVWEKLTEVDGDSVFYTGNFSLFKVDDQTSGGGGGESGGGGGGGGGGQWNEHDALAATANFLQGAQVGGNDRDVNYNSDLQLAMALQQQELDQQRHQHQQQQEEQQQQQKQQSQSPRKNNPTTAAATATATSSSSSTTGKLFTGPKNNNSNSNNSSSNTSPQPKTSKDKCKVM